MLPSPQAKGVDVDDVVNLEIELQALDPHILGQPLEPFAVRGRLVGDGVVGIHPLDRLTAHTDDVVVRKRDGLDHIGTRLQGFGRIDLFAADAKLSGCRLHARNPRRN